MSSNRPETSVPHTSNEPTPESLNTSSPIVTVKPYVPHVFDLVTPKHRARDTAKLHIPPTFLQSEAVDSSLLLGHGASFTVTRQALPPGPIETVERTDMGGWIVEKPVKAPERPRHVVYKAARVSFHANGEPATPQDRRALQSVLTEFHALLHPPLLAHPNIIDFLGLAWGSNHAEPLHRLPVLVVEYGNRGTLADVQLRGSPLSNALKRDLCLGIARGLEALHHSGIIHGDVKPENIIICSHKEKTLVPKLADFGFAVIESTESSEVMIGGTRTWRAPESFSPIPVPKLKLTDVYSFGLVAWSIAIDGADPFSLMLSDRLQGEDHFAAIDRLKLQDEVLDASKFEKWITKWYLFHRFDAFASQFPDDSTQLLGDLQQVAAAVSIPHQLQKSLAQLLSPQSPLAQLLSSQDLASKISQTFRQQDYFKDIESLLAHTLSKNPDDRDLMAAIQLLEGSKGVEITR
jgi:serine/threonine protein kinase